MTLTVTAAVEDRIQHLLESGGYDSVDELLVAALDRLEVDRLAVDEVVQSIGASDFQRLIEEGIWSAENEPLLTPEEARAHLRQVRAELSRG